jgi:hypothetical protein
MADYKCPKCGGSDYFLSKRNIVKGMGWAQRGSLKSVPVCRICDEIMEGAQVGMTSWEDLSSRQTKSGYKYTKYDFIVFANFFLWLLINLLSPLDSTIYNVSNVLFYLSSFLLVIQSIYIVVKTNKAKRN